MYKTTSVMNASVSKEQHAFAKSARFPGVSSYTKNVRPEAFTRLTDFDVTVKRGHGKERHSFGSRNDRFSYTPSVRKHGQVGPANYPITDVFSDKTVVEKSSRYTFGVSRMSMKKSFIEDFQHRSTLGPAPDTYKEGPKFGEIGQKHSMRARLSRYGQRTDDYSDFYRN